ncbi:hypothetical protein F5Y01DRAFT_319119 [Xylaria sp. FL0043]|nr:hypothetical protein F5Y01DRAFT_319119 [Xylaria sp. FL0043]
MAPSDEIQDMSVNGSNNWRIVTLLIGKKRRAFEVHLQRLGPLAAELESVPASEIHRPDWDPEVFNLVVAWVYYRPLPRVKSLAKWFDQNKPHSDLSPPKANEFTPFVETNVVNWPPGQSTMRSEFQTLTAQPQYVKFSVEELRLRFAKPATRSGKSREVVTMTSKTQPDNTLKDKEHSGDADSGGFHSNATRLTIPFCIPDDEAEKAEKMQILLLKLIIFAETHKWNQLFNDAIDAFKYGEAQLRRLYTPPSHIDLVFASSKTLNTLRRFMFEYTMALGYKNRSMSKYQDLLMSHPKILSLMLSGTDSGSLPWSWPGCQNVQRVLQTDPLEVFHHNHNPSFFVDCKCRTTVACSAQVSSSNAAPLVSTLK